MAGHKGGSGGKPAAYQQAEIGLALFDLQHDVGETEDVKASHPEVVAKLQALGERMRAELGDGQRRGVGVRQAGRLARREK
jgi:hypothetical protein